MKSFLITSFTAILFSSALAWNAQAQLSIEVPMNSQAELNVEFDAEAWKGAGRIDGFRKLGSNLNVMGMEMSEAATQTSRVYLTRDNDALYFGFEYLDSDIAQLEIVKETKTSQWPKGDMVEIYLDGDRAEEGRYYHFAFNIAGSRAESSDRTPTAPREWKVVTKIGKDGWRSAIRIPYVLLGIDHKASAIRGLFYRNYHPQLKSKGGNEQSTWGGGALHDPASFGELLLKETDPS